MVILPPKLYRLASFFFADAAAAEPSPVRGPRMGDVPFRCSQKQQYSGPRNFEASLASDAGGSASLTRNVKEASKGRPH